MHNFYHLSPVFLLQRCSCLQGTEIVNDVRKEIDSMRHAMAKARRGRDKAGQRAMRGEMNALRKEVMGVSCVCVCVCVCMDVCVCDLMHKFQAYLRADIIDWE